MRFAYIDSQGNEVTIPSVDALALRIELGAIGPDTELYDGQADRWGPAHSHEIFHTLSRDVGGDEFLVPTPPPSEPEQPAAPPVRASPPDEVQSSPSAEAQPFDGFGLTLTPSDEQGPGTPADEAEQGVSEEASSDFERADFQLDLAAPDVDSPGAPTGEPEASARGEFSGWPDAEAAASADAIGPESEGEDSGLWFEEPLDLGPEESPGTADELNGGMDLEPPMSDFDPSSPPAWMEQDGPAGFGEEGPVMDFSPDPEEPQVAENAGWGAPEADAPPASSARPAPKHAGEKLPARRPPTRTPPRRSSRRRPSVVRPLLLLVLVGGLGAGVWYGWQLLAERPGAAPPRPAVVIPDIPAELEAPMHALAEQALPLMYGEIEDRAFPEGAPQAPSEEWLAGVYLGNASRFAEVEAFWAAVAGFADRLREEEVESFHGAYLSLAEATDHGDDARAMLLERADSGFMATREARLQVYDRLGTLAGAALALHDFLLTHESDIAYTPARGFAGNPVEEAVPSSPEIGAEMWDHVEDITNALDALGTLDRVTRERLSTVVLQRIRDVGIL